MKKLYTAIYIIILVCIVGTVVLLILSPDRVPMHYNFSGEVDRIGSKYENLIWPLSAVITAVVFTLLARRERKNEEKSNEKILLYAGICILSAFTLLAFFFMIRALKYDPEAAPGFSYNDISRFTCVVIGVMLIVLGNIMPKARRNSVIGLRTSWSMANDTVWQKSQRFAGIASVITGLIVLILSLFDKGIWSILITLAIIIVYTVVCVTASRRYYLAYKKDEQSKN